MEYVQGRDAKADAAEFKKLWDGYVKKLNEEQLEYLKERIAKLESELNYYGSDC